MLQLTEQLKNYAPFNAQEAHDREILLSLFSQFDNLLTRDNPLCHLTSSAMLLNRARDKALMVYHNLYGSWAWTGGHADGDSDLLGVAIKEAKEESGLRTVLPITSDIYAIDILPVWGHVKRGAQIASHLHLSFCYLLEGDDREALQIKPDENAGVRWIPIADFVRTSGEPPMWPVYQKLVDKLPQYI